jgi:hypothetical protein
MGHCIPGSMALHHPFLPCVGRGGGEVVWGGTPSGTHHRSHGKNQNISHATMVSRASLGCREAERQRKQSLREPKCSLCSGCKAP